MPTPYREQQAQAQVKPPLTKGMLMFLLPFPTLFGTLSALMAGSPLRAVVGLASFGLFMLGAWLMRRGLHYELIQKKRKWARSTRVPWKLLGALCAGTATTLCVWALTVHGLFTGIGFGIGAVIGVLLTYGMDPQHSTDEVVSKFGVTADEVADMLAEAETKISAIESAAKSIRNPELNRRLRSIVGKTREVLKVIEDDPRDLRRARKFLTVYLDGARSVTEGYAKTHTLQSNEELETNFRNVLTTIEDTIEEQKTKLLENDVLDLDVQIEVLETQLKREGVV